jgi:hypothetical protein
MRKNSLDWQGNKGKMLVSLNDHQEIVALFDGCSIEKVPIKYSTASIKNGGQRTSKFELIIKNY